MTMKKRTGLLVLSCLMLAVLMSGCSGTGRENTENAPKEAAAVIPADIGAKAFLNAEGLGKALYKDTEKVFSNKKMNPGCWKQTETLTVGEADDRLYTFNISGIADTYRAGDVCEPYITLMQTDGQQKDDRKPCGALYFAEPSSDDPSAMPELTVLEYLLKKAGPAYAPVQMVCFTPGNDALSGSADNAIGGREFYFSSKGYFPKKVAEGEEIWLVLELWDSGADASRMRTIWKYCWTFDADTEPVEEIPEDHEGDPEYYKTVFPGHWEKTDVRYLGTAGEEKKSGSVSIRADRTGSDGQEMLFSLEDEEREILIRIPEHRLDDLYYAGDVFVREINIFCDTVSDEVPGSVRCSFYFGDVFFDADGNVTETVPKHFFTYGWPEEDLGSFSPLPHGETMSWRNDLQRGYLMVDGTFPEGKKAGDKLYVVFEAEDTLDGESYLMNICEYTWHPGPETVWIHNPPMY